MMECSATRPSSWTSSHRAMRRTPHADRRTASARRSTELPARTTANTSPARLERAVGVPQPIAQTVHAPPVLRSSTCPSGSRLEMFRDMLVQPELMSGAQLSDRGLERAQLLAEGDLLLVGQVLIAEHQHGVAVACVDDGPMSRRRAVRVDRLRSLRRRTVDAAAWSRSWYDSAVLPPGPGSPSARAVHTTKFTSSSRAAEGRAALLAAARAAESSRIPL